IIDNYISLKTLILFKNAKQNVAVTIFSDNSNHGLHQMEFNDFCKEFPGLKVELKQAGGIFHDRYIILDYKTSDEKIYHCGASSKDGGRKVNTITLTEDTSVYKSIINQLLNNPPLVLN
ncbi:MAG: ORF6N domain-containing protein, partial [Spirochaetaceae bacterium]|nr:ORF6N domain-containing protein [Spirochaetaceae bacterium]